MRWKRVSGRGDVEDRRGQSSGPLGGGGGLPFPIPTGKGGAGGGIGLILLVVLALVFGGNIFGGGGSGPLSPDSGFQPAPEAQAGDTPKTGDDAFEFAKFVSKDAQDLWTRLFQQSA